MILKALVVVALASGLLVAAVVMLMKASTKEPLQDKPVAERAWGKVGLVVRHHHYFELGKPGRAEFRLAAAADEFVARCPEAMSDAPSYRETRKGSELRVELLPTLTGGKCGRRGFEGSSMPADPRSFDLELPDLTKGPATVVLVQGGKELALTARADAAKVELVTVKDPSEMRAAGAAAFKRLPVTTYLALGLARESGKLWGGNVRLESADGSPLAGSVEAGPQYCRGPAPYEYASGDGYEQGSSDLGVDALYKELADGERAAGRKPAFTLYRLGLDGSLEKRP